MSMMPLLSASRSLIGSRDSGKQYRMTEPGAMPKFGTKKKFARGESEPDEKRARPHPGPLPQEREKHRPPSAKFESAETRDTRSAPQKTQDASGTAWFRKLKSLLSRSKGANQGAIPRFSAGPVQCELSLDNVKVLRNDLSDTDFEVVAKAVEPEKPKMPEAKPQPAQANREKIWDRVTTLLGVGQT